MCCVFTTDVSEHIKCWYRSCHCVSSGSGAKKQTNLTLFFFSIVMRMQDNMKALRPEQACWYLDIDSLICASSGAVQRIPTCIRRKAGKHPVQVIHVLVGGILIKAWDAQKWAKNIRKLQLAALGKSFKKRIKACWKYSQPCGVIFIVMLQQLVLGYSSGPVSDTLLLSNLVILHSSSTHRLIMRMYLARPKSRLITINRVQEKDSFYTGSSRKGVLNCTKCQEHRIKKKKPRKV